MHRREAMTPTLYSSLPHFLRRLRQSPSSLSSILPIHPLSPPAVLLPFQSRVLLIFVLTPGTRLLLIPCDRPSLFAVYWHRPLDRGTMLGQGSWPSGIRDTNLLGSRAMLRPIQIHFTLALCRICIAKCAGSASCPIYSQKRCNVCQHDLQP